MHSSRKLGARAIGLAIVAVACAGVLPAVATTSTGPTQVSVAGDDDDMHWRPVVPDPGDAPHKLSV